MQIRSRVLTVSMTVAMAVATACTSDKAPTDGGSSDGTTPANDGATMATDASDGTAPVSDGASTNDGALADSNAAEGGGSARDGGGSDVGASDGGDAGIQMCSHFADGGTIPTDAGGPPPLPTMSFFVTSQKNMTGNLGGLAGADTRCQTLATAVGLGSKTWHAYLSVEHDANNGNNPTNARDRIGAGPWYNAFGVMLAADLNALHMRTGDALVFVDEHGNMINGQWTGPPPVPLEHDILTGSNADGTLAPGKTCLDWTSSAPAADGGIADGGELLVARVGHSDGFGPLCSTMTSPNNLPSWNSAHDNAGCNDTAPRGGAGRIYCFAIN